MKTVLLLGGPASGQCVEVHGDMRSWLATPAADYRLVPMCSHGEVHWFGVLDGADPLALLMAGYDPGKSDSTFDKMLADSQAQVWALQCGLMALIDGTLLDEQGNRNDDGLRDWARSGSVREKVVGAWLDLAETALAEGSK